MAGQGFEQTNQPVEDKSAANQSLISEVLHSAGDLAKTAVYTATCEPVLGVSQIVDQAAGTHSMDAIKGELAGVGLVPEKATGSLDRHAQMLGNAVGMLLPYLLLHKAVRGGAIKAFGADTIAARADIGLGATSSFAAFTGKEAALSFATGFGYDAFLRPSDDQQHGVGFVKDRFLNGVAGGTTMATLTASSLGLAKIGSSPAVGSQWLKTTLTNPMSAGVISAIPSGLAASEVDAVRHGKLAPTLSEAGQNIYQMGFIGLTLGGAHFLGAPREGTSRTNFQSYVTDPIKQRFSYASETTTTGVGGVTTSDTAIKTEPLAATVSDTALDTKATAFSDATRRQTFATGELENIETPRQKAERLGRVKEGEKAKNFEEGKDLFFANVNSGDGKSTDVVIRPFEDDYRSRMRIYRADISERVNQTVRSITGVDSPSLPLVLRDNVTTPKVAKDNYEIVGTTTGPVMIQENGGKQLGLQLQEWTRQSLGQEPGSALTIGEITKLVNSNPDVRALMGRAAFDNMYKGNIDMVEFSQQTLPAGSKDAVLQPSSDLQLVAIDNKNDFTLQDENKPSWGFGSQFGLSLEVAKALEGKRLFEASPQLQTDAEAILNVFSSDEGVQKLVADGLAPAEIEAARQRLTSLVQEGFPKHLGEMNIYADGEAKQQLTASLTEAYNDEKYQVQNHLEARDLNLMTRTDGGPMRVVKLEPGSQVKIAGENSAYRFVGGMPGEQFLFNNERGAVPQSGDVIQAPLTPLKMALVRNGESLPLYRNDDGAVFSGEADHPSREWGFRVFAPGKITEYSPAGNDGVNKQQVDFALVPVKKVSDSDPDE